MAKESKISKIVIEKERVIEIYKVYMYIHRVITSNIRIIFHKNIYSVFF